MTAPPLRPGDVVLWRSVFRGRVRWALPHVFVDGDGGRVALYIPPGTRGRRPRRAFVDYVEQLRMGEWSYREHVWHSTHALRLTPFAAAYSIDLLWNADDWAFRGWYVNLQEPLRRSPLGFDTFDHALDLWFDASGDWRWKDEDDLARLVEIGVFAEAEAAAIRTEGERFLERRDELLPTGWETWRPDPSWPLPVLPDAWADVVDTSPQVEK